MEYYQKSYDIQRQHMDDDLHKVERKPVHESWFREDTADFWRHKRMYETIKPIASFYNDEKWLSVGDGRFGLDSYRLNKMFGINVFPTDISKNMLEKGKEMGIIKEYGIENAEQLSFPDQSYDIVFCKESFHHFPRPIIALYEMVRVSREAVVLIEPNEVYTLNRPKTLCKQLVKLMFNCLFPQSHYFSKQYDFFSDWNQSFEECGNYIYSISRREMLKIAYGLNLKGMAWKGFNDYYIEGCEFERADSTSKVFAKIENEIRKRDRKCNLHPLFYDWGLVTVVLFKQEVDTDLRLNMEAVGYQFSNILHNPYVDKNSTAEYCVPADSQPAG